MHNFKLLCLPSYMFVNRSLFSAMPPKRTYSNLSPQTRVTNKTAPDSCSRKLTLVMPKCVNIFKRAPTTTVLLQTTLIVWDECTMAHRGALEALGRLQRDIRSNTATMGRGLNWCPRKGFLSNITSHTTGGLFVSYH